ncbi:MAG: hypothetical protein H6700_12080 [Myxococcales bacterium]|nr:hypothetical protein [Myxococcales bacterium]
MVEALVGILLLYLYYLLMKWMVVSLVPGLAAVAAAAAAAIGPIAYGVVATRHFSHQPDDEIPSVRSLALLPLLLVLLLAWADVAWLSACWVGAAVPSAAAELVLEVLQPLVFGAPWTSWIAGVSGGGQATVVAALLLKGVPLVPLLLLTRGLRSSTLEVGGEPARLQYFFGDAWTDLGAVLHGSFRALGTWLARSATWGWTVSAGPQIFFTWPLVLVACGVWAVAAVIGGVTLCLLATAHVVSMACALGVFSLLAGYLTVLERAVLRVRRQFVKCPYANCHQPVALPIYRCPDCGVDHSHLVPGRYGIVRRECVCGRRLPTLIWTGKRNLPSACPHCRKPLEREMFAGGLHLPIYGGPSVGKTMFLTAASWWLVQGRLDGVTAGIIGQSDHDAWTSRWKPDFEAGRLRPKTHNSYPDAFLLSVRRRRSLPISLYLYDPAGEALSNDAALDQHRFLRHADGVVLLIDPYALPAFADELRDAGHSLPHSASKTAPMDSLDAVTNALARAGRTPRTRGYRGPVAVILTKVDDPTVREAFDLLGGEGAGASGWRPGGVDDARMRTAIRRVDPTLVHAIESRFPNSRFFACSSTGAQADRFDPTGFTEPLKWLLSHRFALRRPWATRALTVGAQFAAAGMVTLLFNVPVLAVGGHLAQRQHLAAIEAERASVARALVARAEAAVRPCGLHASCDPARFAACWCDSDDELALTLGVSDPVPTIYGACLPSNAGAGGNCSVRVATGAAADRLTGCEASDETSRSRRWSLLSAECEPFRERVLAAAPHTAVPEQAAAAAFLASVLRERAPQDGPDQIGARSPTGEVLPWTDDLVVRSGDLAAEVDPARVLFDGRHDAAWPSEESTAVVNAVLPAPVIVVGVRLEPAPDVSPSDDGVDSCASPVFVAGSVRLRLRGDGTWNPIDPVLLRSLTLEIPRSGDQPCGRPAFTEMTLMVVAIAPETLAAADPVIGRYFDNRAGTRLGPAGLSFEASSSVGSGYRASNLNDDNPQTSWRADVRDRDVSLDIRLGRAQPVCAVELVNGLQDERPHRLRRFWDYGRLLAADVVTSSGRTRRWELSALARGSSWLVLDCSPVDRLTIRPVLVQPGSDSARLVVTEVRLYGP